MKIGIPKEIKNNENRVGATPAGVKELVAHGHELFVQHTAGEGSGFADEEYVAAGATILPTIEDVYATADMIIKVKEPIAPEYKLIRKGQLLFTYFHFASDRELLDAMLESGATCIAYETVTDRDHRLPLLIPMSEVAGRMSIQEGARFLEKPQGGRGVLMGGVPGVKPAKVLVLGAGIAGLQAIGTTKRLGAVVTAYDVRPASKDEVESLGAKFLDLGLDFSKGQGEGGYARALTAEEQAQQQAAVDEKAAGFDIIITTAKVPGRKPPMLLTARGVEGLHRGAVIVDCAASDLGGNVEGSEVGTHVTDGGVTVIGAPYLASEVSTTASNLLSRNVADILVHFIKDGALVVDPADEIDAAMVVAGAPTASKGE